MASTDMVTAITAAEKVRYPDYGTRIIADLRRPSFSRLP
jgi:hypothetical protein